MYSIRSDRPLDAITGNILHQFDAACHALNVDYVLIGATARDILLTHVFGVAVYRATRDVDFAVAVPGWQTFDHIRTWFLARPNMWSRGANSHRLLYRDDNTDSVVPMDVIPFGGIENSPGTIAWPPDMSIIMTVAGFAEALQTAIRVQIGDDLVVPVASIPGLTMLKLLAWAERRTTDHKDADDLLLLLRHYAVSGNEDRLYGEAIDILEMCDYDLDAAGAFVLGLDVAAITNEDTRSGILALLSGDRLHDQLLLHMARSLGMREDSLTYVGNVLTQFVNGLSSGRQQRRRDDESMGPV